MIKLIDILREIRVNNPIRYTIKDIEQLVGRGLDIKSSHLTDLDNYNKEVQEYNSLIQRLHKLRNQVFMDDKISEELQKEITQLYLDFLKFKNK